LILYIIKIERDVILVLALSIRCSKFGGLMTKKEKVVKSKKAAPAAKKEVKQKGFYKGKDSDCCICK